MPETSLRAMWQCVALRGVPSQEERSHAYIARADSGAGHSAVNENARSLAPLLRK
jgi:hypothetical protein